MRLGYDLRPFLKQETGVGVYLRNLLFELASFDRENEYFLFSASWKDRFPPERIPPFERMTFVDRRWPVRAVNALWDRIGRPRLDAVFGARLDLAHSPTPLPLPAGGASIVTVCDLFFLDDPARADREARKRFVGRAERALRSADGVLTISEHSAGEIRRRFDLPPSRIGVTPLGLNRVFMSPPAPGEMEDVRSRLSLDGEFLLFVGASEGRKNLPALIDALAVLHAGGRRVPLVLAGRPGGDHRAVLAMIERRKLGEWVRIPGYLSEIEIRALYHAASALVFPSLGEGFGLPLLEAMACGLPAAVSSAGAMPEVGGDAALYFRPDDPRDIADALGRILEDEPLRISLRVRGRERARGFSWRRTAEATLDFYRKVLERA